VVIRAHNARQSIEETVRSVLAQTVRSLEVIVVDDGSTDGTAELVQLLMRDDARLRIIRQKQSGVAAARNAGIDAGIGQFVAPIDADDVWLPSKLEKQISALERGDRSVGMAYTWTTVIDPDGQTVGSLSPREEGDVFLDLIFLNFVGHASGSLIRRECLERVGMYDTEFFRRGAQGCEDWDLYLRIAAAYEVKVVPEFLVKYRTAPKSMSRNVKAMIRSFQFMQDKLRAAVPGAPRVALRWAASNFCQRQIGKAVRSGDYFLALSLLSRACASNPIRLFLPSAYRMFFRLLFSQMTRRHEQRDLNGAPEGNELPGQKRFNAYGRLERLVRARAARNFKRRLDAPELRNAFAER
jgi:glycosyltransferase involved in cell wall biosynthesis